MKDKRKNLNDKEYIKVLFDEDGIKAPDSLSEDNVMAALSRLGSASEDETENSSSSKAEKSSWIKAKRRSKHRALKWIGAAACAVIAVFALPQLYYSSLFMPNTSARGGELYTFKSKGEISHIIKSFNRRSPLDYFRMGSDRVYTTYETEEAVSTDTGMNASEESQMLSNSADATASPKSSQTSGANHSSTYLQVDDVDEADIVKVDGRYIYCVSNKQEVVIYEAAGGKVKKLSVIGNNGVENYVSDIFLKGNTLVTIGRVYEEDDSYIAVVSYDINDRSNPVLINQFRQSGSDIVSSRMVGSYVYLVTNTYAYYNDTFIPKCTVDGEYREMNISDISCVPSPKSASYTILSAVDIASGKAGKSRTKALFGSSDIIYCNNHNLYISVNEWDDKTSSASTRIVRAGLDGLNVKFNGTASVRGSIINQFSMDEHNGFFRIATTSERNGMDVNNLFVLDEKLSTAGKITSFARDESIKAVRFMGDKAYVITYEAIDPLFVMDLSDPANPSIEGEVKIDGFSSLLVPVGKDRLLGIGHATGDNGYGGQYASGLKLALFDVSDASEPKVLDSKEFKDMSSPAQSTHLALTVNEGAGYYAIPYYIWRYSNSENVIIDDGADIIEDAEVLPDEFTQEKSPAADEPESETGVLVFGIGGSGKNSIEIYVQHKLDADQILRNAYIEDYLYGITGHAEVLSFKAPKASQP